MGTGKCIAIIPARGGSKRIPRKNIKLFLGKPVLSYSIDVAVRSKCFDVVMVSTDDDEIADVARSFGAEVPFKRSAQNSNDYASTVDVILEVLDWYKNQGAEYQYGCCIYPTAPLISVNSLLKGLHLVRDLNHDTSFPIQKFAFPIQRALEVHERGTMGKVYPADYLSRSQDLEPRYHDTGQFYWFNIERMILQKSLLTDNSAPIILSELEAQDIDSPEDWDLAEIKYKMLRNE